MKTLVVIAHFFKAESEAAHSSMDGNKLEIRRAVVERVIATWRRTLGGPQAFLNLSTRKPFSVNNVLNDITIVVLTHAANHLLNSDFLRDYSVNVISCPIDNPRMLGFEASNLFSEHLHSFDNFIFTEDDILVDDTLFLDKFRWFNSEFGPQRLLMPNRFERTGKFGEIKMFIDGTSHIDSQKYWVDQRPDNMFLSNEAFGSNWTFRRAENPHSGMHVLSREQVEIWRKQPHWNDRDISFVSPLESAATLGVLKTFSIYKSWGRFFNHVSVEHLDSRYSKSS